MQDMYTQVKAYFFSFLGVSLGWKGKKSIDISKHCQTECVHWLHWFHIVTGLNSVHRVPCWVKATGWELMFASRRMLFKFVFALSRRNKHCMLRALPDGLWKITGHSGRIRTRNFCFLAQTRWELIERMVSLEFLKGMKRNCHIRQNDVNGQSVWGLLNGDNWFYFNGSYFWLSVVSCQ
jgi:hypothetical protein